jgi:hypothetical protein
MAPPKVRVFSHAPDLKPSLIRRRRNRQSASLTKEDPRYYTLGHGGVFKRTDYAISRLLVTRKDSGGATLNLSEIVGAGAAAGISNLYYPPQPNPWVKTYQLWISEVAQDGLSNIAKEFWPDINHAIFHGKY